MAGFWEYFLNSGLQKPDDPGDPSMPYGPPLWPMPQPDLSWATRSADPNEIAAQRVRDKYHADQRAPARWPEFLANVIPNTLHYVDDLGNRLAVLVSKCATRPMALTIPPQPWRPRSAFTAPEEWPP